MMPPSTASCRLPAAQVVCVIPFHDTDPMAVAWHGHYLKYFELARCALLQKIDYDYPQMRASGYMWPIVEAHLKYVKPARYGQAIRVAATLMEYENRLRIDYLITDEHSGQRLTRGYTIQVAVAAETGEMQFVSPSILYDNVARWRASENL